MEIVVKFLIPVIAYGNIAIEATREVESEDFEGAIDSLRKALALSILPLVNAEVARYASILLKEDNPRYWLSRNSTVFQWFCIANPDVKIPMMEEIIANQPAHIAHEK